MIRSCKPMNEQSFALMKTYFSEEISKRKGYVIYEGYVMPGIFAEEAERIDNFDVYDDDIWVCSFPKSGESLLASIIYKFSANLLQFSGIFESNIAYI